MSKVRKVSGTRGDRISTRNDIQKYQRRVEHFLGRMVIELDVRMEIQAGIEKAKALHEEVSRLDHRRHLLAAWLAYDRLPWWRRMFARKPEHVFVEGGGPKVVLAP